MEKVGYNIDIAEPQYCEVTIILKSTCGRVADYSDIIIVAESAKIGLICTSNYTHLMSHNFPYCE